MKKIGSIVLVGLMLLASCKNENSQKEKKETYDGLPNYSNVDLDKVFSKQDRSLDNREALVSQINNYYDKVWEKGNLSGSFLVAKADDVLVEKYRGYGRENDQMPINENVPLHVASISKTMTAMTVLKLVDAGKISLDDDLTKFFPGFPYPDITVFSLLSQRSGLPKYEHFDQSISTDLPELKKTFITNDDVLKILIRDKPDLARASNTGFMYCNTNYVLLALIVEKVTKTKFPDAIKNILFKPLGMKHSFVFQEKDINTASQSFYNGNGRLYPLDHLDLIYGDKNIYTTPRDLLKFSTAMFSKDFLKSDLYNKIFEPYSNEKAGVNNYGLGFRMKVLDNGEKVTYHNGWWHGSNTVFVHLLKSKVTIVAIGNKYSQRVYSAMALSGLFENFPAEKEKIYKIISDIDTTQTATQSYTE